MTSTDVLNATYIPVDDRVYRLLPVRNSLRNCEDNQTHSTYYEEDDEFDINLPINHQGNIFFINFHIPYSLTGLIVGKSGKMREALEKQYGAKINIPPRENKDAGITIRGSTKKMISQTYLSIMEKVISARLKKESTHFVSFPINSANIQESFLKFKEDVLKKYKTVRGIDPSIFQKPSKLHASVAILVLLDERDNQQAISILTKCKDTILKDLNEKQFVVQVKGLEYMNDDPAEVDVLYGKLEELDGGNRLQILSQKIMKEFVDAKLSRNQYDEVKLHITLMNTLFRERLESNEGNSERITFDARKILNEYGDYDFGQIVISEIHISIRYTQSIETGYYNAIHKMNI